MFCRILLAAVIVVLPAAAFANLINNPGFETPAYEETIHDINPQGTGWTFTAGDPVGAGTGIDRGDPYGIFTNSTPASGDQMAFLQAAGVGYGVSSISQELTGLSVGTTYNLDFQAKGIMYDWFASNPLYVSVGGTNVSFDGNTLITPPVSYDYTPYHTTFVATAETETLRFYDLGDQPFTQVSWIDDVSCTPVPEPSTLIVLLGAAAIGGIACIRRRS